MASYCLGKVYIDIGKLNLAQKFLDNAKILFEMLENKFLIGLVMNSIAYLRFKQKRIEESKKALKLVEAIIEQINLDELRVNYLLNLGLIINKSDPSNAEKSFLDAIEICQKNKYKKILADVYYEYARFLEQISRKTDMKKYYNEAMKIYRSMGIRRKRSKE